MKPSQMKCLINISLVIAITIFWNQIMDVSGEKTCKGYVYYDGAKINEFTCTQNCLKNCQNAMYSSTLYACPHDVFYDTYSCMCCKTEG